MKKIISILLLLIFFGGGGFWYFENEKMVEVKRSAPEKKRMEEDGERLKIVAVGDSLTAGYGLNLSESYPKQLEKKLNEKGYPVELINMGVSGETTAGLLERIEFIKKQKPEIVMITTGGNDVLRALPLSETRKNIQQIILSFKEVLPSQKIFLMKMEAPSNLGVSYVKEFSKIYEEISRQENIQLIPFVVPEVFLDDKFMQNDGIHPNGLGYKVLVEKYILEKVESELK